MIIPFNTGLAPTERMPSLAEQIYRRLRQAIITGSIEPGRRLREVELAALLAASRTPLREAIARLVGDRLVRALPQGGVEVVDTNLERGDIHEIRVGLECTAIRLAAQRITPDELVHLDGLIDASVDTPLQDFQQRSAINAYFHDRIRAAARSDRLMDMIHGFREFFLDAEGISRLDEAESRRAISEHENIVAALRHRDPERCERLIRKHFEGAYRSLARPCPKPMLDDEA
jgi:DNA-binding GntR family transcriptional regulator